MTTRGALSMVFIVCHTSGVQLFNPGSRSVYSGYHRVSLEPIEGKTYPFRSMPNSTGVYPGRVARNLPIPERFQTFLTLLHSTSLIISSVPKLIAVTVCLLAVAGSGVAQEIEVFSDGFDSGHLLTWSNMVASCAIPQGAGLEDVSSPTTVVGSGTPASCTSAAFVNAVAQGGIVTFDCGPDPVTITLEETARVFNDTGPEIVIDGGGLITLSGGGSRRILYMNTCDQNQVWTTSHCQNQDHPRLTVQNLTFINANSTSEAVYDGGGAIWVRGGRFKVVNCSFHNNVCGDVGPDLGGAGIRVFSQYEGLPVFVVNSSFGAASGNGNWCSNGGGISSIGVSWTIINSTFSRNDAIGNGGNPSLPGTPGGGSGGAIYNDGNMMTLSICGSRIEYNQVNAHGSAIFFVSNDHSGNIVIDRSVITNNVGGSWYPTYPQISNHSDTPIDVSTSIIR